MQKSHLGSIPKKFRDRINDTFIELKERYFKAIYDSAWDTSGLSSGKFCEVCLRFLQNELTGAYTPFGTHIKNFQVECQKIIALPKSSGSESLRVLIPRALMFLYTLRGKRGIGHVGGDIENNQQDAFTILNISTWVYTELIRIYHNLSLEDADNLVRMLVERKVPEVWEIEDKKRVLNHKLNYKQKVLLLLYSEPKNGVLLEDLFDWTEHSNISNFKRDVIMPLHKTRMIEYSNENSIVYLSPLGIDEVEKTILIK